MIDREQINKVRQRDDPFLSRRIEAGQIMNMFFRPEEFHEASGIGSVQIPIPKGQRAVGDDSVGVAIFDNPVLDLHLHRQTAIATRSIDLNGFAWEKPADR